MSKGHETPPSYKLAGSAVRPHHNALQHRPPGQPIRCILERWGIIGALFFGLVGTALGVLNYYHGREAERRDRHLESIGLLNRAWDLMGGRAGTTTIETSQFASSSDLELAHRLIEKAFVLSESAKAYSVQATYFLAMKQGPDAVQSARRAIELDPGYAAAHSTLGVALREEGEVGKAIKSLQRSLELDGHELFVYVNLALALRDKGQLAEAAYTLQKACEVDRNHCGAHAERASELLENAAFDKAVNKYLRALGIGTETQSVAFCIMPEVHIAEKQYIIETQLIKFEPLEFVEFNPEPIQVHYLQRLPEFAVGHEVACLFVAEPAELVAAVETLRLALALNPYDVEAQFGLAFALFEQGKMTEAADAYRRVLELYPYQPSAVYNLAPVLQQMGRTEEAEKTEDLARLLSTEIPHRAPLSPN